MLQYLQNLPNLSQFLHLLHFQFLLGLKTSLNEMIASLSLAGLPKGSLNPHSMLIMVYALCGFANFSSQGILIAGTSAEAA
ncbi:MAG: nucleoside transporter C-terminal domain-containing protein [Rhizomicrobium sp.]